MRLWSLHQRYLDGKGLTAAWREALLARAVLSGQTRGYRAHPQLVRFRDCRAPLDAINGYLHGLFAEACARGFAFDGGKLPTKRPLARLTVTGGNSNSNCGTCDRSCACAIRRACASCRP